MPKTIFQQILDKAKIANISGRSETARKWFRRQTKKLASGVTPQGIIKDGTEFVNKVAIGNMYHYFYDAKTKDILPFWDKFPLCIVIEPAKGGFLGLNLHYLAPKTRAILLAKLDDLATNRKFAYATKLKISYDILNSTKKFKEFRPALKRYLNSHLKSRILKISPMAWEIALFLPTESFQKRSKNFVWKDSGRKF